MVANLLAYLQMLLLVIVLQSGDASEATITVPWDVDDLPSMEGK
tara:strand:+ start:352 stop:483 length:132 start_codon:yes stop_codon:yes gene_type:complete